MLKNNSNKLNLFICIDSDIGFHVSRCEIGRTDCENLLDVKFKKHLTDKVDTPVSGIITPYMGFA